MFDKRMEDSGIPPWCAGLNYRRSDPPRHDSFEDESRTDKLGAFKYVCVGYAESKYPFYSRDADEGGGEGGAKGGEQNKLPYCEGILMLVTDRVVKERTRDADEDADTSDASTSGSEGPARAGRPLPGLGVPGLSSDGARARERGGGVVDARAGDKPIVEPGYITPSAEFERKLIKSAGKIVKNMKRHADYIATTVSRAVGGGP